MVSDPVEIDAEDRALIERVAGRIVALHLEVPAILTIEGARPMSVLAGQAMIFFEPIAQSLFRLSDYQRFARLVERRDHLEELVRAIERRADAARPPRH